MYNLCKLRTNESNGSVGGHPFDVIKRSDSIDDIFVEIQKVIVRYYLELIDLVTLLYSLQMKKQKKHVITRK